ncbi:MAG: sensor histidine kinase [Acidimicrobiales bacterium]
MNLQTIRIQLTALFGLLAAIAVGLIAWIAISTGSDRIVDSAEREAENVVRELALAGFQTSEEEGVGEPFNTWRVNIADEWQFAYGETWVEPPLFTIGDNALNNGGHPFFAEFQQDGPWLAYAEPIDESDDVVIAAVSLVAFQEDQESFRFRVILASLAAIVGTTAAAWFVAGRSLRPARSAMARQRDFIADAAHELRTPLAVIRASASHALSRDREKGDYQQALAEILTATERAGSGVGELLELARLDAGQAQPRKAPLRVDLLVEEVAESVRVDGVEVIARPGEAVVADADYALLRQVVENLTYNAASRATEVELSVTKAASIVTIHIADDGEGFDEEILPHVFERFRRGDNRGSTGLGMAIAKSIIDAHGGSVAAANKSTGGAIVKLHLPASKDI